MGYVYVVREPGQPRYSASTNLRSARKDRRYARDILGMSRATIYRTDEHGNVEEVE